MSQELEFVEEAGPPEESFEERLREYWGILLKRRRLVLLCVAVCLVVAGLISVLSKPSYLGTVTLSVDKDRSTPLDTNWRPELYGTYDPQFLPTQARLMTSREIAERVVRKLNLVENRELNPKKSGFFRTRGKEPLRTAQAASLELARRIQHNTEVEEVRGTNLVALSYAGPAPKLAADVANAMAETYIEWTLEAKSQIVGRASQFLAAQIDQLKNELAAKEQQLLAYGRQKDIISVDPQTNVTLQKLETFNRDYADAVADRVAKEARYYELRTARPDPIADTLAGGLVTTLRNEQLRLEREYAEKLNLFKPEWPAMQQLKAQIDKGKEHLDSVIQETVAKAREQAKSEYLTALRREESLHGVLGSQKSEAMVLTSNAVEYNNLRVEVESKRGMLDTLLKRLGETEAMSRLTGQHESNVQIVDRALASDSPFRPSYAKNGLLGLFVGSLLGVGLAFLLSFLDRSLRTPEQVEEHLRLPALGVIPAVGADAGSSHRRSYATRLLRRKKAEATSEDESSIELLPHRQPRSRAAESYRAFRTALLLSRAGGVKSLVVTSSFSREGKTATAVNLAVVLGQLAKRVLLVDADLHRPRLHEVLQISNRVGLVSILAENLESARAIIKTELPGVFAVPSGPSTPNPSGLLSSEAMTKFLDLARNNFDYVILDAPPVAPVADPIVLGYQADGVVLCVKGGETPRDQVARMRDKLLRSNVRILGVVINALSDEPGLYGQRYDDGYYGEAAAYGEKPAATAARTI